MKPKAPGPNYERGIAARKRIGVGGDKKAYGPNVEPDVIFNGATPGGGLGDCGSQSTKRFHEYLFHESEKRTVVGRPSPAKQVSEPSVVVWLELESTQ